MLYEVITELTSPAVLTMEVLDGVRLSAVGTPAAPDLDPAVVARRGADAVLTQILVHGIAVENFLRRHGPFGAARVDEHVFHQPLSRGHVADAKSYNFV